MEGDYLSIGAQAGDYLSTGAQAIGDYLSTLPEVIEIEPMTESGRFFTFDRGDYMLHVAVGILMDDAGLVWVAGDYFPYRVKEEEGKTVVFLPPLVLKYPKKDVENLSHSRLKAKVRKQAVVRFRADLVKAGYHCEELFRDLDEFIHSDLGDQINDNDSDEEVEAHNMEQEPPRTNIWTMEPLNSSLDNCAMGNCVQCLGTDMISDIP